MRRINLVSAAVIETEDKGSWDPSSASSGKRGVLFFFLFIMMGGVGMAVWIGAKWYFSVDTVSSTYPGTALCAGTAAVAFRYAPPTGCGSHLTLLVGSCSNSPGHTRRRAASASEGPRAQARPRPL